MDVNQKINKDDSSVPRDASRVVGSMVQDSQEKLRGLVGGEEDDGGGL